MLLALGKRVRRYWTPAGPLRQPTQYAHALASKLLGRWPLFTLRPPNPSGGDERPSTFDSNPMRHPRYDAPALRVAILSIDPVP